LVDELDREIESVLGMAQTYLACQRDLGLEWIASEEPGMPGGAPSGTDLDDLRAAALDCRACRLCEARVQVVFGAGRPDADVMFVGEAPGAEEDRQGIPFVGAAGGLLTRMIEAIDLAREDVYIANVIKCRPPANRDPKPDEIAACEPYLKQQIEAIKPALICTLGRFAAQVLLQTNEPMGKLRGRVSEYQGVKLIPTYHPSALLRNPKWKRPAWEDLQQLRSEYDALGLRPSPS